MKRLLLAGAAFAALTGFAVAQTSPDAPPPPPAQSESPSVVITPPPPADTDDAQAEPEAMGNSSKMDRNPAMRDGMQGERPDRRGKDRAQRKGDWGHRGMRDRDQEEAGDRDRGMKRNMARHMGYHGRRHGAGGFDHGRGEGAGDEDGARFTFQRPGKGKVDIRCAPEDSTQECVDAVLPMLRDLMREGGGDNRIQ